MSCSAAASSAISKSISLRDQLSKADLASLDENKLALVRNILSIKNSRLQADLAKKLTKENLPAITADLLAHAPRLLETCLKILTLDLAASFNIQNVTQRAQDEALFMPKPQPASLKAKISSQVTMKPGLIRQIVVYAVAILTFTYHIDLNHPPKSHWAAQSQWMFFRDTFSDIKEFGSTFLEYFETVQKAAAVALAIVGAAIGITCIYQWFQLGQTAQLNQNHFQDLTAKDHPTTLGRSPEQQEIISCICVPPGERPNIPILISPPGMGKTQLVEGLAQMIRSGEIPQLKGKQLLAVNTADLAQTGSYATYEDGEFSTQLDRIFKELKGKESNVILFFDEIHNATSQGPERVMLLELLKTKLLEKNILCILATTEDEYKKLILPNQAFVDRTHPIPIGPLSHDLTKHILQRQFISRGYGIEIEPEAVDAVLKAAEQHPVYKDRANPRKSIDMLQYAVNHVHSWTPHTFKHKITDLETEIQGHAIHLQSISSKTPEWQDSGKLQLEVLKQKRTQLEILKTNQVALSTLHQSLLNLQDLQKTYRQRNYTLVHQLAESKLKDKRHTDAEKSLIWIEFIVLPALRSLIAQTIRKFKTDYQETVPIKVNPELIDALFPPSPQKET